MRVKDIIDKLSKNQWIQIGYNTHEIKYKGKAMDCPDIMLSYEVFMILPFVETIIDKNGNIKRRHIIRIML